MKEWKFHYFVYTEFKQTYYTQFRGLKYIVKWHLYRKAYEEIIAHWLLDSKNSWGKSLSKQIAKGMLQPWYWIS